MTQCAKNERWESFDLSSTIKTRLRSDWTNATNYRTTIRTVNDTFVHERVSMLLAFERPALRLFTNRSLTKTILPSTRAWKYCPLTVTPDGTTLFPPTRAVMSTHAWRCWRTKEGSWEDHQPIVTTDETILSARALEGRWEIETVFYFTLNDSKARRPTLWSMFTIERLERDCRCRVRLERVSNKAQSGDSHADCFSRKSPIGIFARKASFTARMRSKCGRSLAGSAWSIPGRVWGFGPSKSVDYPSKKLTFTSLSSVGTRMRHRKLKILLRIVLAIKAPF